MQEIKDETNVVHGIQAMQKNLSATPHPRHKVSGKPSDRRKPNSARTLVCRYCRAKHAFRKEACPAYGKICSSCGKGINFQEQKSSRRVDAANIASSDSSDEDVFVGTIKTQQATAHAVDEDEWTSELEINWQAAKVKLDTM